MKQNPPNEIEVKANEGLTTSLSNIFLLNNFPKVIIETGTYLGTGTTKILADIIKQTNRQSDVTFYTIEAGERWVKRAKENLTEYPWVNIIHGLSINKDECIKWIESDEYLINHHNYPDIYIDDIVNPVEYYKSEFRSDMLETIKETDALKRLINEYRQDTILFCLDSCGGTGYLEFKTVVDLMAGNEFYIFMDDAINHVKHIRSAEEIRINKDGRWGIIYEDDRVLVAKRYKLEV